jgi:flavin reductase (DIM6/NTAB) family NADH-FMN oxidoreductase RutF
MDARMSALEETLGLRDAQAASDLEPRFDAQAFRRCLGHFATGVTVVTAEVGEERVGITMNSFTSVSLDPPLILWSIGRNSRSYSSFCAAKHFAINILSAKQAAVSRAFTGTAENKFAGIAWTPGHTGAPVLDGVVAVIECEREITYPGGDHVIIIGRVRRFESFAGQGLLFAQGRYAVAQDYADADKSTSLLDPGVDVSADILSAKFFTSLYWAFNSMSDKFAIHRHEMGFDLPQTRVISQLYNDPNIFFEQLLRLTYLAHSTCEEAVNVLLGRGEVVRDANGRLSLSSKGRTRREVLARRESEFERRVTAEIPPDDMETVRNVLEKIRSRLQTR